MGEVDKAASTALPVVELSIVIPAYNEEFRLPGTLEEIVQYFHERKTSYEVLVVDDGSSDGTCGLIEQFSQRHPSISLLSYAENRGKGYAVRYGVLAAQGSRILFADADGATSIAELERLETALDKGADVAIGSRAIASKETKLNTVWYRKLPGRVFAAVVNCLVLPGIKDTQCGFKLFSRVAARQIFSLQQAERFSFDVEILFLARRGGYKIAEVPINWTNMPGSKVNLFTDSFAMFRDVIGFRLRALRGGYGTGEFDRTKKESGAH